MAGLTRKIRHRSIGVAFLAALVGLVYLSILFYNHAFTSVVPVTLDAESAGTQLIVPADVKLRGIIVGQVRGTHITGNHAVLDLALEPDKIRMIPADVEAMIIPKTLFGEKYVDLEMPKVSTGPRIAAHDTISLDHSATAIEAEKVFNDLVPLLDTLQPVQLNLTLSNIANTLQGKGNELGENLVATDDYLRGLNPDLGNIDHDFGATATFSDNVDSAVPDLFATLRQFSETSNTFVAKSDVFAQFLTGTRGFADIATNVLTRNENNLVQLAAISKPNLALLAKYSPEFPCLTAGLTELDPELDQAFTPPSGTGLHLNLELSSMTSGFTYPKDLPDNSLDTDPGFAAPRCYGLPGKLSKSVQIQVPVNAADPLSTSQQGLESMYPVQGADGSTGSSSDSSSSSSSSTSSASGSSSSGSTASDGTNDSASQFAQILAGAEMGTDSSSTPSLASVLTAPQLAGTAVSLK